MDTAGITHVRIGGEAKGPLRPAQLRELAEGGAITPATEAAASADGPWRPIREWPEHLAIFPPRPILQFKAPEFEAVNRGPAPPVDHRELIAWANLPAPAGGKPAASPGSPITPKPEPVNDVLELVREVARVDALHAKPMVFPDRPKLSRRFVHYLILAATGNALLGGTVLHYWPIDELSAAIFGGWAVLFNGGLAFIMLTMVPRY
ncbi:MAG TPA: DUF4339 domain-containing protein [Lacunisphaera sp.]|nr:DUF4339 domain-containing protein [Lacunisphaera sp.]